MCAWWSGPGKGGHRQEGEPLWCTPATEKPEGTPQKETKGGREGTWNRGQTSPQPHQPSTETGRSPAQRALVTELAARGRAHVGGSQGASPASTSSEEQREAPQCPGAITATISSLAQTPRAWLWQDWDGCDRKAQASQGPTVEARWHPWANNTSLSLSLSVSLCPPIGPSLSILPGS